MAYSNFYGQFYVIRGRVGSSLAAVWNLSASRWYAALTVILQIIAWAESIFIYRNLTGDLLILHYNVDFGIDLVGVPSRIFVYPLVGLGVFILNLIIAIIHNDPLQLL